MTAPHPLDNHDNHALTRLRLSQATNLAFLPDWPRQLMAQNVILVGRKGPALRVSEWEHPFLVVRAQDDCPPPSSRF